MARVLFFASVAEAAGMRSADVEADTLGSLLEACVERYGEAFAEQLQHCRVLVDGDPADPDARLNPDTEVAVLPPVAGGAVASFPSGRFSPGAWLAFRLVGPPRSLRPLSRTLHP